MAMRFTRLILIKYIKSWGQPRTKSSNASSCPIYTAPAGNFGRLYARSSCLWFPCGISRRGISWFPRLSLRINFWKRGPGWWFPLEIPRTSRLCFFWCFRWFTMSTLLPFPFCTCTWRDMHRLSTVTCCRLMGLCAFWSRFSRLFCRYHLGGWSWNGPWGWHTYWDSYWPLSW